MRAAGIKRPVFYGLALGLVAVGTTAAAVPGDPLKLGVVNSINALTTWSGAMADRLVLIQNSSAAAGARALQLFSQGPWSTAHIRNAGTGPALQLQVGAGRAPIVVNADAGKATNLDADKLDGADSRAFGRVADFSRTVNATSPGYRDMATLGGLVVGSDSHIAQGNLLTCDLFVSTTAPGQLDNAWIYDVPTTDTLALSSGSGTPVSKFFVARGRGNGSRSVGQLVFRNAGTGHAVTVAYSVYGIPNADVNNQGCTWQGTVTAAGW